MAKKKNNITPWLIGGAAVLGGGYLYMSQKPYTLVSIAPDQVVFSVGGQQYTATTGQGVAGIKVFNGLATLSCSGSGGNAASAFWNFTTTLAFANINLSSFSEPVAQ
jgi:hypothetical protein